LSSITSSDESRFVQLETQPTQPTLIGSEEFSAERGLLG